MDSWLATVLICCIIVWFGIAVGMGLLRGLQALRRWTKSDRSREAPTSRGAFPVMPLSADKTRCYRIVGVDAQTRADLDYVIDAATSANAKVKAELAGVIVTEVVEAASPLDPPTFE